MSEEADKIVRLLEAYEDQVEILKKMLASRDDTIELYQERLKVANAKVEAMNTEVRILRNQSNRRV
jgi:hypothetical protein